MAVQQTWVCILQVAAAARGKAGNSAVHHVLNSTHGIGVVHQHLSGHSAGLWALLYLTLEGTLSMKVLPSHSRSDQITLHLFQPHQANQMFDPQTDSSYVNKH